VKSATVMCVEAAAGRTLSVFLQDPGKQQSVNSVLVSSGWAQATGVGSESCLLL